MRAGVPKGVFPGAMIGDKYRIEGIIASGGQGIVVEATHLRLRQRVAIKFAHLDDHEASETERHERLFREARAAFRLRSEHVARVIDVDIVEGSPFIVMEFLRGTDLKALIAARGPLPCDEAVGLILQACEGLAEAHDLGLVHRDLKPSNLFLVDRPSGPPLLKILDFGLAKQLLDRSASADDPDLTEPLIMLGSPRYMSPEQARDPRQTDGRTDIWSIGLVLQELLTGRPVFRAQNKADVLALVMLKNPTPVSLIRPEVPAGLERALLRCLQKLPEHRFPTIRDLAQQLAEFAPSWAAETVERLRRKEVPGYASPPYTPANEAARFPEDDLTPVLSTSSGAAAKWKGASEGLAEPAARVAPLSRRGIAVVGAAIVAGTVLGLWWNTGAPVRGRSAPERRLSGDAAGSLVPPSAAFLPPSTYALEPLETIACASAEPPVACARAAPPAIVADAIEGERGEVTHVSRFPPSRAASSQPLGKRALRGGHGRPALSPGGHSGVLRKTTAVSSSSPAVATRRPRAHEDARATTGNAVRAEADIRAENPLDGRK